MTTMKAARPSLRGAEAPVGRIVLFMAEEASCCLKVLAQNVASCWGECQGGCGKMWTCSAHVSKRYFEQKTPSKSRLTSASPSSLPRARRELDSGAAPRKPTGRICGAPRESRLASSGGPWRGQEACLGVPYAVREVWAPGG